MTREQLENEYLEICEVLEREPTEGEFSRFFKDPQFRRQLKERAEAVTSN